MFSKTKFFLQNDVIIDIFKKADINNITDIKPLGNGEFNAIYSVNSNGKGYVLKVAPTEDAPILTYEKDMMASEIFWYTMMEKHTNIRIPKVYCYDKSKSLIPTEYFIMERLEGETLDKIKLTKEEKIDFTKTLAQMVSQIHNIKNDKFGYIQNTLYDNWYLAIRSMTECHIESTKIKGRKTKRGQKLLSYIDKYKSILEKVECVMVNFDLWALNFICNRDNNTLTCAWIDPERSFWGDRMADFVCLEFGKTLEKKHNSISAYNTVSDKPFKADKEHKIRYAILLGYAAVLQETEKYYRYTYKNFNYWRNIITSTFFYSRAFKILKKESK